MQATSALVAFGPLLCSTIHLAGCPLSGQIWAGKNSQADWGRVCAWLFISACEIILQGCLWIICPMVAKKVYFWFGRSPMNCQLIMQRKCYSQLVNFLQPSFQHRGTYLCLISQKITHPELRFCFDLPLIIHFPRKRNLLAFRVWLQSKETDTMNGRWTTHCIDSN